MDEAELISRARLGDRVAGRELYDRHTLRTRALRAAVRAGARPEEIGRLAGEGNSPIRETVVTELLQIGSDGAIDAALSLVSSETDTRLQRRLVSRLSRSEHPRVRTFLQTLVER